jgi:hypothetical protein
MFNLKTVFMKNQLYSRMALLLAALVMGVCGYAQQSVQLKQVIVASGGAYSDPDDYVTISALNPETLIQNEFATIYTQAVQDVLVDGKSLYVAATDSLVLFDLDSFERIDAVALPGLSQLYAAGDYLFVSIQFPETSGFLKVFKRNTLVPAGDVIGISDEAAGMLAVDTVLYVAVPGGWMSTKGTLAKVNINTLELIEEIDLGDESVGIYNLFLFDNKVVAVSRTPWGSGSGVITVYDPVQKSLQHVVYNHVFGKGIATEDEQLYLFVDNGIGVINLSTLAMIDSSLVEDPGSGSFIYFADAAFDYLNQQFYATTTDYFSFGQGHVFDLDGSETGLFAAGISPEAIAFDYRNVIGINNTNSYASMVLSPNPAGNMIRFKTDSNQKECEVSVFSVYGKRVLNQIIFSNTVNISSLPSGYYILALTSPEGQIFKAPFVKVDQAYGN